MVSKKFSSEKEFEFTDETFNAFTDRILTNSKTRRKYEGYKLTREQLENIFLLQGGEIIQEDLNFALQELKKGVYIDDKLNFLKNIQLPKLEKIYNKKERDFTQRLESALNNVVYHLPRTVEIRDAYEKNNIFCEKINPNLEEFYPEVHFERGFLPKSYFLNVDISKFMGKITEKNKNLQSYDHSFFIVSKKSDERKICFFNILGNNFKGHISSFNIGMSKNKPPVNFIFFDWEGEGWDNRRTIKKGWDTINPFCKQMKGHYKKYPKRAEFICEQLNNYSTFLDMAVDNFENKLKEKYHLE